MTFVARFCFALALTFSLAVTAGAAPTPSRTYHVGNSLTGQTVAQGEVKNLAAARNIDVTFGYHVRGGQGLGFITANPNDVTYSTPANFNPALPNNTWDIVTLQTYGDTYDANKTAIRSLINLTRTNVANQNTKFYIFTGWPQDYAKAGDDYSSHWLSTYDPNNHGDFQNRMRTWSRGYSNELMSQLNSPAFNSPVPIGRVPTGEVFYQLDQLAGAGQLGAVTDISQWYSDAHHMGELGAYVSQLTMFATLYGENPAGLPGPAAMSPEVLATVQQTVWNVVSSDPYAAVPEPGGLSLLAAAAAPLLRRRRNR
jgi:MYXO-CTERM domain-containing protein